jgi:hypothetical protein
MEGERIDRRIFDRDDENAIDDVANDTLGKSFSAHGVSFRNDGISLLLLSNQMPRGSRLGRMQRHGVFKETSSLK